MEFELEEKKTNLERRARTTAKKNYILAVGDLKGTLGYGDKWSLLNQNYI